MVRIIAAALIVFIANIQPATAQQTSSRNYAGPILPGDYRQFTHTPTDEFGYIGYCLRLLAGEIGFIGFKRVSGTGDHDIRIGRNTSLAANTFRRASLQNIVALDDSDDDAFDLLVFTGDGLQADQFCIEAWSYDNAAGTWIIAFDTFNVFEEALSAAGWAMAQLVVECMLTDCNGRSNDFQDNVGRALNLGMSVATRSNICAVGVDVVANEAALQFDREFPGNRFLSLSAQTFIGNLVAKVANVTCVRSG